MTNVNGNSGSQAFAVPYAGRIFYLYNNAISLAQSSATASCASGTAWDGSQCSTIVPPMSGAITPASPSCTISSGANSCNVTLTWSTTNPQGTSAVTAVGMTNVNGNSGSQAFAVPYAGRIFYLYNNSIQLTSDLATSACTSGTAWDGTACDPVVNGVLGAANNHTFANGSTSYTVSYPQCSSGTSDNTTFPPSSGSTTWTCDGSNGGTNSGVGTAYQSAPSVTATLNAVPTIITNGNSSTLTWSSTGATTCSGTTNNSLPFNTGGATSNGAGLVVTPNTTTTYTLTCNNSQFNNTATQTITVNKQPSYIEH
jgi:hypothetical protein